MTHLCKLGLVLASFAWLLAGSSASAQSYFDDFESYSLGTLDKNDTIRNGPNQAPNGSGNPWFGPEIHTPNAVVVGPESGVQPYSGNQMIRGWAPNDTDQDWVNLAFRLNGGLPFTGNISFDWWFYDPIDPNDPTTGQPTDYRDFGTLGFYDTTPTDRDGPDNLTTWNLATGANQVQRISLGASSRVTDFGFDADYYQARVVNAGEGLPFGWFNTLTPRSVGWHHAMISVGPPLCDGTNDLTFFIDDLTTPTFEHNSVTNFGYNVLEINVNYGPRTGYFDDINFTVLPCN